MRWIWMLALLLPCVGRTEMLYRCVDVIGVAYQAHPCKAGAKTDRTIAYTPEVAARATKHEGSRDVTFRRMALAGAKSRRASKPNACRIAKQTRERKLEALGLKRTFHDLSRLDKPVRTACEGF